MSQNALHCTFVTPEQSKAAIAGLIGPYCRQQWQAGVERLSVVIQPEEDARSIQQNRFYWGVVLQSISLQARINGTPYVVDAWHELFKRQFLPRIVTKTHVAGRKRPVVTSKIGTTTGLSVRKMSAYLEQVIAFAVTDLGVRFPEVDWRNYR